MDECKPLVDGDADVVVVCPGEPRVEAHDVAHRPSAMAQRRRVGPRHPPGLRVRPRPNPPRSFGAQGRAVQLDPIKPTLKAPGFKRLKLRSGKPLSSFAFKVNLRRYIKAGAVFRPPSPGSPYLRGTAAADHFSGRGLQSSTSQLNLSRF